MIRFGAARVVGAAALGLALLVLSYLTLAGASREGAEGYAARAAPAAASIDRAMNRVFSSFDGYLHESRASGRDFKGVDDFDEIKRRLLPIYRQTNKALIRGRTRVAAARAAILEGTAALSLPPDPVPTGDAKAIEEAETIAAEGADLVGAYDRYLASYSEFVDYRLQTVRLYRRFVEALSAANPQGPVSLTRLTRTYSELRSDFGSIRSRFNRLRPHPDARQMHATDAALLDSYLDYVDDLERGVRNGDATVLLRAAAQFFEASHRLSLRARRQLASFAHSSRLQTRSRALTASATELETQIAALGRGLAEPREWRRSKLPPGPQPSRSEGAERLS